VSRTPAGGHVFSKNSVLRCFAVFCGVLRCFVCVFLAFFTKNSTKQTKKYTKRTKRTKYALCNTAQYGAVRLSLTLRKCLQKTFTKQKHVQNIAKHPQNTAKHCFSKNTRKTPQNTRKTPQNIAKHHKTDLLTKQTELANKPLRSL